MRASSPRTCVCISVSCRFASGRTGNVAVAKSRPSDSSLNGEPGYPLLPGPSGGVLPTAIMRDATKWDELVTSLGLPNLTRHGLRHTGTTRLADADVPLRVLRQILGHASTKTTKCYLHPDHRHLSEAAPLANQFFAISSKRNPSHRQKPAIAMRVQEAESSHTCRSFRAMVTETIQACPRSSRMPSLERHGRHT